jgi:REP element-mobilizing transposase RayT
MNRGIARRAIFEYEPDMAAFMAELGEAVDRGLIEIHSYCLMNNHFHLLVRSPSGELHRAMQGIQTQYSKRFNRIRGRDGPLVRSRYRSKPVETLCYRRTVVRYIDRNPIKAGIVRRAADYPFGSARQYVEGAGPDWLERSWIEATIVEKLGAKRASGSGYQEVFGRLPDGLVELIEQRWRSRGTSDPLDELMGAPTRAVKDWLQRNARHAGGEHTSLPVIDRGSLARVLRDGRARSAESWLIDRRNAWTLLEVGLARDLCGETFSRIAEASGKSAAWAHGLVVLHHRTLRMNEEYAHMAATVGRRALLLLKNGV